MVQAPAPIVLVQTSYPKRYPNSASGLLSPQNPIPLNLRHNTNLFASLFDSYPLDLSQAVEAMNQALVELWSSYAEEPYNIKVIAVCCLPADR